MRRTFAKGGLHTKGRPRGLQRNVSASHPFVCNWGQLLHLHGQFSFQDRWGRRVIKAFVLMIQRKGQHLKPSKEVSGTSATSGPCLASVVDGRLTDDGHLMDDNESSFNGETCSSFCWEQIDWAGQQGGRQGGKYPVPAFVWTELLSAGGSSQWSFLCAAHCPEEFMTSPTQSSWSTPSSHHWSAIRREEHTGRGGAK